MHLPLLLLLSMLGQRMLRRWRKHPLLLRRRALPW